jgi:hypothetical protein
MNLAVHGLEGKIAEALKVMVLDTLWEKLPRPPFTEEETEILSEKVYDFVWQQSAGGWFPGKSLSA